MYSATYCATLFGLQNYILHPEGKHTFCGANGIRTRVQTRNTCAFYTLIPALFFVRRQDPSHQPPAYLLSFQNRIAACESYSVYFCAAWSFSPQTRLGATSRSGALRPKRPIYYTSIRQREHKKCCQLDFEARLTSVASLLGVLTQPFYLLSKPNSPKTFVICHLTFVAKKRAKVLLFFDMCKKMRKNLRI